MEDEEDINCLDIERAYLQTGGYGCFQLSLQLVWAYCLFVFGYQTLLLYFTADNPSWRCTDTANNTFCATNTNRSISIDDESFNVRCDFNRHEWEYETSRQYSLVTEYDLVCSKASLAAFAISVFYLGWGFGGIAVGTLADTWGRKPGLFVSFILLLVTSFVSPFVTDVSQFIVVRTILGAGYGGTTSCGYILLSEFIDSKNLSLAANVSHLPFYISVFFLILAAYFEREWRTLSMYLAFPSLVVLLLVLLLPESPKWLLARGKEKEAIKIIKKVGVVNKKPIKQDITLDTSCGSEEMAVTYSYIDFFKSCRILLPVMNMCYAWFASGMLYYGLSFEASGLGGDMHMDLFLITAVDIPATFISAFVVSRFGCKWSTIVMYLISSLFMVLIALVPSSFAYAHTTKVCCAMVGKMCVSAAFNTVYIWAYELYPTVVRTQGFIICQIAARLGSACAPFVVTDLRYLHLKLPYLVFGTVGATSGVWCVFMPNKISLNNK